MKKSNSSIWAGALKNAKNVKKANCDRLLYNTVIRFWIEGIIHLRLSPVISPLQVYYAIHLFIHLFTNLFVQTLEKSFIHWFIWLSFLSFARFIVHLFINTYSLLSSSHNLTFHSTHEKQSAANYVTSTNSFNFLAINSADKKHCWTDSVDFFVGLNKKKKKRSQKDIFY